MITVSCPDYCSLLMFIVGCDDDFSVVLSHFSEHRHFVSPAALSTQSCAMKKNPVGWVGMMMGLTLI